MKINYKNYIPVANSFTYNIFQYQYRNLNSQIRLLYIIEIFRLLELCNGICRHTSQRDCKKKKELCLEPSASGIRSKILMSHPTVRESEQWHKPVSAVRSCLARCLSSHPGRHSRRQTTPTLGLPRYIASADSMHRRANPMHVCLRVHVLMSAQHIRYPPQSLKSFHFNCSY